MCILTSYSVHVYTDLQKQTYKSQELTLKGYTRGLNVAAAGRRPVRSDRVRCGSALRRWAALRGVAAEAGRHGGPEATAVMLLETAAARGSSVPAARGETAELRGDGALAAAVVVACCSVCSAAAAHVEVLQNHDRWSMQQRRCADGGAPTAVRRSDRFMAARRCFVGSRQPQASP